MAKIKIEGNASGTGTLTISAPSTNTDRSLTLPDGAGEILLANGDGSNLTGIAGNTPAFRVSQNTGGNGQSITQEVWTLLACETEEFDTDNAFDNTSGNYKFTVPTGKAGKYFFYSQYRLQKNGSAQCTMEIRKNGSQANYTNEAYVGTYPTCRASCILDLSEGDYIQVYVTYSNAGSSENLTGLSNYTNFGGFKIA